MMKNDKVLNVKNSRNIMNEKPQSKLGEKTSEIFYSGILQRLSTCPSALELNY